MRMAAAFDGTLVEERPVSHPPRDERVRAGSPEAARERRDRSVALLLVLSAGWGALFVYSAAYLAEDLPLRQPSRAELAAESRTEPVAFEVASNIAARLPPAPASEIQRLPSADPAAVVEAPPARTQLVSLPADPAARTPAGASAAASVSAEFVGIWGPTGAACGARSRRRGYLPATITQNGARAGRTVCSFRDGHRTGNAWLVAAECSDRGRRWSSQVRLVVDGDRLTWSSARGSSSYVRCRRAG